MPWSYARHAFVGESEIERSTFAERLSDTIYRIRSRLSDDGLLVLQLDPAYCRDGAAQDTVVALIERLRDAGCNVVELRPSLPAPALDESDHAHQLALSETLRLTTKVRTIIPVPELSRNVIETVLLAGRADLLLYSPEPMSVAARGSAEVGLSKSSPERSD